MKYVRVIFFSFVSFISFSLFLSVCSVSFFLSLFVLLVCCACPSSTITFCFSLLLVLSVVLSNALVPLFPDVPLRGGVRQYCLINYY